jgi:hypothetical protein
MARYGTFRFGQIQKYGRYTLGTTQSSAIGPYVRYRIRLLNNNGTVSKYIEMINQRITITSPTLLDRFRIRADNGEWVYMQSVVANYNTSNTRVRSILDDGSVTEWVNSNRGNLKLI